MFSFLQVQLAIEKETDHLEDLVTRYRIAAQTAAQADSEYKITKAQALLRARSANAGERISVEVYDAMAIDQCQDQLRAHLNAAAILDAVGKEFRATEARMDALRTLAASHRAAGG